MEQTTGDNNSTTEESSVINDSPIEQVRLTVPITDDPTLPVITFRTWIIGSIVCSLLAFSEQYFSFRQTSPYIPVKPLTLIILPIGKLMAATLPTKVVRFPVTNWKFSMNPGPFNIKEHVLISIFATSGLDAPSGLDPFVMSKIFYQKKINPLLALLVTVTTQVSGYGFAGIFMHFLVSSPHMWWPSCLVDVAMFRAIHEQEVRSKGHLTSLQFFILVSISSFTYAVIPNYFFPSITALSVVCWFWKHSVLAQQIGSGRFGLGIGSIAIDWSAVSGMFGNPLVAPMFAIVNSMVGFILFQYIITPISYWSNTYNAKRFPFSSYDLLDFYGQPYNTSRVVNKKDLTLNVKEYENYSKVYMSTVSLYTFGFDLAMYTATLTDFVLFHARDAWCILKESLFEGKNNRQFGDIHNSLMRKYDSVPQWWFFVILVTTICLSIFTCEGFGKQLEIPYLLALLGFLIVFILILPFGVIRATTGQSLGLHLLSEMIIGYSYHGKPLVSLIFNAYGFSTMAHALKFISDFKLGHYMKIPPKSMFLVQVFATILSSFVNFVTAWWVMSTVDHICDPKKLPLGSPWTCPWHRSRMRSNIIWGLVGPSRVYAPYGLYSRIYYFFLLGFIASMLVWLLSRLFPKTKWIRLISLPMLLGSPTYTQSSGPVCFWTAFVVALVFNCFVYRRYKRWWSKYNYLLASGLDLGIAILVFLTGLTLQAFNVYGVKWWGLEVTDHCPLATCPTAPGVQVDGCPVLLALA